MPPDHQPAVALSPHVRHVVWDWNGTLLDDLDLVVDAVNAVLARSEVPPIDVATYTATYTRPVRQFYERLHGRPLADAEWRTRLEDQPEGMYSLVACLGDGGGEPVGDLGLQVEPNPRRLREVRLRGRGDPACRGVPQRRTRRPPRHGEAPPGPGSGRLTCFGGCC